MIKNNSRNYFKEIENKCQYSFVVNCDAVASSMHWKSGLLPIASHVKNNTWILENSSGGNMDKESKQRYISDEEWLY